MVRGQQILLVEPQALLRELYVEHLQKSFEEFDVIGLPRLPAADDVETLDRYTDVAVCVVNIGAGGVSGTSVKCVLGLLKSALSDPAIVVIADGACASDAILAIDQGVRGFVPTDVTPLVMIEALRLVLAGEIYVPASMLLEQIAQGPDPAPSPETVPKATSDGEGGRAASTPESILIPPQSAAPPPEPLTRDRGAVPANAAARVASQAKEQLSPRQREVLGHLCQGQSNKSIAFALGMQESTVKVHVRHIMRKLNVTNRTQIALMAVGALGGPGGGAPPPLN